MSSHRRASERAIAKRQPAQPAAEIYVNGSGAAKGRPADTAAGKGEGRVIEAEPVADHERFEAGRASASDANSRSGKTPGKRTNGPAKPTL